jgi:hypothetical protein
LTERDVKARGIPDNPPPPDVIAQEIVDDLETALEQFRLIAGDLNNTSSDAGACARSTY